MKIHICLETDNAPFTRSVRAGPPILEVLTQSTEFLQGQETADYPDSGNQEIENSVEVKVKANAFRVAMREVKRLTETGSLEGRHDDPFQTAFSHIRERGRVFPRE